MARPKTGLDKQDSILPIVIIGLTIAIVVGLIAGALWGIASSGKQNNPPTPLPSLTTSTPTPTPTPTSATPTPTTASPTPTSASPTVTSASPTPTTTATGAHPAWPGSDVYRSGNWSISNYTFDQSSSGGKFSITGTVINGASKDLVGYFTLYLYDRASGTFLGTASATQMVPMGAGGARVTFASDTKYQQGAGLIFVASP